MNNDKHGPLCKLYAWLVHALTASGTFFGILSLVEIYQHEYINAFWLMGLTVLIDAVDGTLARAFAVKKVLPYFDGTLLDNIVDYLNYVVTPCFFLLIKPGVLPESYKIWLIAAIAITSSYQFCQDDAKTPDHFFKGFPCYWNFAVFYMFIFNTSMMTNVLIVLSLCVLIFVPIKYVYPSRLDYLTKSKILKILMHLLSILYGLSAAMILYTYPNTNLLWLGISLGYVIVYLCVSVYRTYYPLFLAKITKPSE